MPTTASHCGAKRVTLAVSTRPPARTSSAVSSSARAVARATTLVMPRPSGSRSSCSSGRSTRLVKPAAYSAGQNRFPGRAKWYPVAAEYSPGLIPENSTRSPGPATSGMVLSLAAVRSQDEGRRLPVTTSRLQPVVTTGYCSARPRRAASVADRGFPLRSRLPRRASAREDIDGRRREKHRGDHDVNPPARHAKQVEAVVDGTDDEAAQDAVDGLAPAAEEAGATDDGRGHRQQHVAVGGLDDVRGQRDLPRGEQHAGDPRGQGGEDEAPGSDGGKADPGSPRRLRVAADGVHVAAEAGPLQQDCRRGEHDKDDRNDVGNPLDRPEVGPVDVANGDDRDSRHGHEDDLHRGEAPRRSLQAVAALAGVPQPEPRAGGSDHHGQQDPAGHRVEPPPEDVVEDDLVGKPGVADADERPTEDDDRHPLQDQQPAESDYERRHLQPGHERSLDGANRRA